MRARGNLTVITGALVDRVSFDAAGRADGVTLRRGDSVLRIHNLMRRAPANDSMRLKRKAAAWDDDFLVSLISI